MAFVRDQRRSNWAWFQHAVLDDFVETGRISSTDFTVYAALCRFVNSDGEAWPATATLGKKAGVGNRTAQRSIQRLQEVGLIAIERRRDDLGRDLPSVYVLLEPPTPEGVRLAPYPDAHDAGRVSPMTRQGVRLAPEQEPREQEPENKKRAWPKKEPMSADEWIALNRRIEQRERSR